MMSRMPGPEGAALLLDEGKTLDRLLSSLPEEQRTVLWLREIEELDYAQIEVGICAAEHHDQALIAAFNSGDVYAAVAQQFYAEQLAPEDYLRLFENHRKR